MILGNVLKQLRISLLTRKPIFEKGNSDRFPFYFPLHSHCVMPLSRDKKDFRRIRCILKAAEEKNGMLPMVSLVLYCSAH